jgi:hypothetical protein
MPGDETHDYLTRDHSLANAASLAGARVGTGPDEVAPLAHAHPV